MSITDIKFVLLIKTYVIQIFTPHVIKEKKKKTFNYPYFDLPQTLVEWDYSNLME